MGIFERKKSSEMKTAITIVVLLAIAQYAQSAAAACPAASFCQSCAGGATACSSCYTLGVGTKRQGLGHLHLHILHWRSSSHLESHKLLHQHYRWCYNHQCR